MCMTNAGHAEKISLAWVGWYCYLEMHGANHQDEWHHEKKKGIAQRRGGHGGRGLGSPYFSVKPALHLIEIYIV